MIPALAVPVLGVGNHGVAALSHPQAAVTHQNTASFSDTLNIGAAAPDRIVVVVVQSYDGTSSPLVSAITIAGVTPTLVQGATSRRASLIAFAPVPTGTTAAVAITMASNTENVLVDLFTITGCTGLVDSDSETLTSTGTTISALGLTAPADSVVVAVAGVGNDATVSWSALTKYADQEINATFNERFSSAAGIVSSPLSNTTLTMTHGSANNGSIAAAVFY